MCLTLRQVVVCVYAHIVKPCHSIRPIFALNDGFVVLSEPVVELGVELNVDNLQMPWIMVPGHVAVHTDDIHEGSLRTRDASFFIKVNYKSLLCHYINFVLGSMICYDRK